MLRRAAVAFVLTLAATAAATPGVAVQPSAPALSTDAQLSFLQTARIVSTRPIGKGVTGALRVTLSDGTLTHDAAFQGIAETARLDGRKRAGELRFVDHYRYNLAAWRLASLLGLGHMMPPTIERRVDGRLGALAWWVDDVLMDEAEREEKNVQPPDPVAFTQRRQRMAVFAELVRDTDRNRGNVVYTRDWRVIMLDFTRAFRLDTSLRNPSLVTTCDRALLAAMRRLTREQIDQALDLALTNGEVKALLDRRDVLVAHFDRLVAERGEGAVLY